jgi:hypothetical protein
LKQQYTSLQSFTMISMAFYQFFMLASVLCVCSIEAKSNIVHDRHHRGLNFRRDNGTTEKKTQVGKLAQHFPIRNSTAVFAPIANITSSPVLPPKSTSKSLVEFDICTGSKPKNNESEPCISTLMPKSTSTCSTVLKGFFTKITVTDCSELVTFYKTETFIIATATGMVSSSSTLSLNARQLSLTLSVVAPSGLPIDAAPELKTYVQKVSTYWVSPWQAVAADEPKDVTVIKFKYDENNVSKCSSVKQVWVTYTKYMAETKTSTISVSTSFSVVSTGNHAFDHRF